MKIMNKTILITIAALLIGLSAQAQELPKGIDYETAITPPSTARMSDLYGTLLTDNGMYIIFYKQNTIGLKKSHEKVLSILSDNDASFSSPALENSFLASYIEGYYDYGSLSTSVDVGGSLITKMWNITDDYQLFWICSEEGYSITIAKMR